MSDDSSSSGDENEEIMESRKTFECDLGHVAAFDTTPVDPSQLSNAYLKQIATENMKLIFKELLELPRAEQGSTVVNLPQPVFRLPRFKPIPKPKPETKWEKFAREKGIDNRKKRDRMVWDEETQTWAPRFGYGRHQEGGEQAEWCIELSDGDEDTIDKFKQRREVKKLRVLKNRAKFLKNQERGKKSSIHESIENLDVEGARGGASKRGIKKVSSALQTVQVSTASLGRFDPELPGEPKKPRLGNKKRQFEPTEKVSELDRDKKILSRLLGKHLDSGNKSNGQSRGVKSGKKKGGKRK